MFDIARLQAGETLLVQGGSSGIGVTAIQLAKALGAKVIVTAGSDDKCAACVALGADHAINYRTQDFVAEVKRLTDGRGVDVVLDMVAGDYVAREVECLADDGRIAIIAVQGGTKSAFDAGAGAAQAAHDHRLDAAPALGGLQDGARRARCASEVWPLLEAGRIKPVIHQVFPAEPGCRGARADGVEHARRQDRADAGETA